MSNSIIQNTIKGNKVNNNELDNLARKFDLASDAGNKQELLNLIQFHTANVESIKNSKIKATIYYFIANAWFALRNLRHTIDESTIWLYEQEEINNEIIFLRKSKQENGFSELQSEYRCSVLTNLGNIFSHCGRSVYAISLFNEALKIDNNFVMAKINLAKCLEYYMHLNYDDSKLILIKSAYANYINSMPILNLRAQEDEYFTQILNDVVQIKYAIENHYNKFLNSPLNLINDSYFGKTKNEQNYSKWVLRNSLFLHPINDLGYYSIAAIDTLSMPSLLADIKTGFPKYFTYFNIIKQEFIAYRQIFYEGIESKTAKYYSKNSILIDDYDYNIYNIHVEKIKLAFRGFYSIFDKIAYFLNFYLNLGFNENYIDFKKIWKKSNNHKVLNERIHNFNNIALRGLYFISKDLFDESDFKNVLEPEAAKINEIRNHLEHKFIAVKLLNQNYKTCIDREEIYNISQSDLEDKTIKLAKLTREAIMYLAFAVHINENRKIKNCDAFTINLSAYNGV